jgi:hypothetical protein
MVLGRSWTNRGAKAEEKQNNKTKTTNIMRTVRVHANHFKANTKLCRKLIGV